MIILAVLAILQPASWRHQHMAFLFDEFEKCGESNSCLTCSDGEEHACIGKKDFLVHKHMST
jgi:hypothetical protein